MLVASKKMVKPKDEFHTYVVQLPQVLWEPLCDEAATTGRSIARIFAEILQKRYRIPDSDIPPPKKPGRRPQR